jgi:hypothetical protein
MQKLKQMMYTALLISCAVSCKDTNPCIQDQCCIDNGDMILIKAVTNARADLANLAIYLEGTDGGIICPNSTEKVKSLPLSCTCLQGETRLYKYRVWGKLLECKSCTSSGIQPITFFNIEKIEKIN